MERLKTWGSFTYAASVTFFDIWWNQWRKTVAAARHNAQVDNTRAEGDGE